MSTAIGIVFLIVIIAIGIAYQSWLARGIKPRVFQTSVPADVVRSLFVDKVARTGWSIVDDGDPMVAQSPLITGHRQQIGLTTTTDAGRTTVDVRPLRWRAKSISRVPTKSHTLRLRMNSFVYAVRAQDPSMQMTTGR